MKKYRRSKLAMLFFLAFASVMQIRADSTAQSLPFSQNWTDTTRISADDNWSGVPGIIGYRGDDLTTSTGTDPRLIVADGTSTPVDVNANQTTPDTFTAGGVAEFELADPTIALNGSGTADAPFILISVTTAGRSNIRVQMNLRDLDASVDNAVMQVAVQYRVGPAGNFSNVFYVADATTGPSLATLVTPVDVVLPADANNQALVQVRVLTTNAVGNDEWVGVDGISITGDAAALTLSPSTLPNGAVGVAYSEVVGVLNNQQQSCIFTSTGTLPDGLALTNATAASVTVGGTPTAAGTFNFGISADCGTAGNTSQSYSVIIAPPAFACEVGPKTSTPISMIQGIGTGSPKTGTLVDVEGIVVADFQPSTQLRGFYLQEPEATWDSDAATSEGIFVFDNLSGVDVNVGDRVRVRGTVAEFATSGPFLGVTTASSLTEIVSLQDKAVCSTGNTFPVTAISLPTANEGDLERYEGMAVKLDQLLTVTGNDMLGTFGQLDLAPSVLYQPTTSPDQAAWTAQKSLNRRSVIALDDFSALANANLYPTLYPEGGLSAENTLRIGALVNYDPVAKTNAPLSGALDERFGEYRLQPTAAVTFHDANARPAAPQAFGRLRAASANVLNFFTTFGSRGAANQTEFDHQKTKLVEELIGLDAHVYGLTEMQNFASGGTSGGTYTTAAVQSLVDGLNCKKANLDPLCANPPSMPFSFIDTIPLGASNGTDAIRNAIVYRVDRLVPVGAPALYYQNDGNRPTIAQTFQPTSGFRASRQTFTLVVSHFKSKGSACGGANDDPLQGNCNAVRLNMAQNVVAWLAGNPTHDPAGANRRLLLIGDFNAYFGEDPIQFLLDQGYVDLAEAMLGASAYTYQFGSQLGSLDHAMANGAMNRSVRKIAEWHTNSDEPPALQALGSNLKSAAAQTAYYAPDPFAASDHDAVVIWFNPLAGDFNEDGVIGLDDQQLILAAIGKKAADVDRRMDADGDGVITLEDYRAWLADYRASL